MLRTRTDHLTKVVQTLYLVYIPPNETGSPQTAHLCILPKGSHSNLDPLTLIVLVTVNTSLVVLTLVFVYSLVTVFALLLLASFVYLILRCLEPPSPP